MPPTPETERWRRWAQQRLHQPVALVPVDHPGQEARVLEVRGERGTLAYLKQHRVADKWRREQTILALLADPPTPVPPLLATDSSGLLLLLGVLPGTPATRITLSAPERRSLHEQAGRFRRRLDTIPIGAPDPTPVIAAMARRHRAWCERARGHLSPTVLTRVERVFDPGCFEGTTRRWCHRDLAPHNWIVEATPGGPRLGILDFGRARPDVWLVDVLELWDRCWVDDPSLPEAFWAGYGRRPDPGESRQLQQLALLHGLATATWGDRHRDAARSRHGRITLHRALEALGR
ncbi:MAG: phosphotransferase [Myxococcota bacterium]